MPEEAHAAFHRSWVVLALVPARCATVGLLLRSPPSRQNGAG